MFVPAEGSQDNGAQEQSFEEYMASGGFFPFSFFDFIQNFEPTADIDLELAQPKYKPMRTQATHTALVARVELTPDEMDLYGLLRELDQFSPIYDQCLLAEITRVTDPQKYKAIAAKFPKLFAV